jgi:hypothetical protein
LEVSYGILGNFFPQICHEVKKPEGHEGEPPFSFLKNSYIMKLMPAPKKPFLDRFPFFFFVRSVSSKSNLIFN